MINDIWQSLCLAYVNIYMYAKFYQNIQIALRDRTSFTVFQDLNLGNASANSKWHLTISWATSCQYQCVCKISSQQSTYFDHFHFFRIWSSAQLRPMLTSTLPKNQADGDKWQVTESVYFTFSQALWTFFFFFFFFFNSGCHGNRI